ncbi:MAG: hypothetical protein ACOZJZ_25180 [Pseudomonadota bacterium]
MRDDRSSAALFARWKRAWSPSHADDPADYGTAFGLDLSMEGGVPHPAEPAAPAAAPGSPHDGWLARWWRRA